MERELQAWFDRWGVADITAFDQWIETMRPVEFECGQVLVSAGQRASNIFLVRSGFLRLFYTTPDGKERNKAFYGEGEVTGAVSAALTGTPAPFSIEALESGRLFTADVATLKSIAARELEASQLFGRLMAGAFIRNERREALLLTCNAEQRYRWLLQHEPGLVRRVAQFHIASYLGVDAVSLSRLKARVDNKEDDEPR